MARRIQRHLSKHQAYQYQTIDDLFDNPVATGPKSDIMETAEILHQIERTTGRFERAAVEAAIARREEITPELLRILEHAVNKAKEIDAEGDYMAHLLRGTGASG
jgi:hypothetical protein